MKNFHALRQSRATLPAFMAEGVVWGMVAAYMPVLKAATGADDGLFGLLLLCGSVGAITFMRLAPAVDRHLGRFGMAFGAIAMVVALQGMVRSESALFFALLIFLTGGFSGLHDVVMNTRLSAIEGSVGRSLMNLNHGFFSLAYALSAFGSGLMREAGWTAAHAGLFWGALVLAAAGLMTQRSAEGRVAAPVGGAGLAGLQGAVLAAGLVVLVAFLAENATEAWAALHIERTLDGDAAEGAGGPAMLGLTMALGRLMGQAVVARFDEGRVAALAALIAAAGALVAALAGAPWIAQAGFAVLGLGISVIAPMVLGLVGRKVPASERTRAIARVAMVGYFGFFVGPPLMGFLSEVLGLRAAFLAVAVLVGLVPLILRRIDVQAAGGLQSDPADR